MTFETDSKPFFSRPYGNRNELSNFDLGVASCWSTLRSLVAEWQQRVQSRFALERLGERDLADIRLTRLEVFDETQKPFWQE
jgi:uncharacterized protein YjiS (DUF1127 family)